LTHVIFARARRWVRHIAGVAITVGCVALIAAQTDLDDAKAALSNFHWILLVAGVVSLVLGYAFRIVRWAVMLRTSSIPVKSIDCVAPFLGAIALNNVLPFRAGDVVRALVFPRFLGVSTSVATATLVMERLVDLVTILGFLTLGVLVAAKGELPAWLSLAATTLAIVSTCIVIGLLLFGRFFSDKFASLAAAVHNMTEWSWCHSVLAMLSDLLLRLDTLSKPAMMARLLALSVLVWVGEAGFFLFLLLGFGLDASPAAAALVMATATLSTMAPSAPGYVGPFHLAAFAAISVIGGSAPQAASFAVLAHLALWMPTTVAGVAAMALRPDMFRPRDSDQIPAIRL
jgi:glycosyltransferase 2 family protein